MSRSYKVLCDYDHSDPRWLACRRMGIGASEMAILLGESHWSSPFELWSVKTGQVLPRELEAEAVEWGVRLEPLIIQAYEDRTGRPTRKERATLQSIEHPWALASLDAWTADSAGDPERPLEVKATGFLLSSEWVDGPPEEYRIQIHQQMLVTGAQMATICALIGGQKLAWCDVGRDETLIRQIIYHGERFWRRVEDMDPPAVDGSEYTARALGRLHPLDDGSTVVLDGEFYDIFDELEQLKGSAKSAEKRIAELENRIKAAMGDATRAVLPNGWEATWKLQKRAGHMVAPSESRVLRRKAPKEQKAA